jgi:glutamyl-tRNA reductase
MSVLVVGLSHKSAPVSTLERAVLGADALGKLLHDLAGADDVAGCFVVDTCNRVEVYAEVGKFHGGVAAISELLARHAALPLAELTPHLYVHYEDRAIQHLLAVTCSLDSMIVGESQILGQVRQALSAAREHGTLSGDLSRVGSLALRAGKRAHSETGIDRAGANLVSVGLAAAAQRLRAVPPSADPPSADAVAVPSSADAVAVPSSAEILAGLSVLVVGAGSMSSLAVATACRMGAASLVVANRSAARAQRLVATVSGGTVSGGTVSARTADLARLPAEMACADLVVCCTGAPGHVITTDAADTALQTRAQGRTKAGRPLVLLDLALPRDVDPAAASLDGVSVLDLEEVGAASGAGLPGVGPDHDEDVAAIRRIVAEELAAHLSADRAAKVVPTVVALRAKAAGVVEAELTRLSGRVPGLDTRARREIAQSMRRIADKLLHAPTVRVKELAGSPGGDSYEAVLRVLFDLDPEAVQAVTRADAVTPGWPEQEAPR